jgi:hypothetical protein
MKMFIMAAFIAGILPVVANIGNCHLPWYLWAINGGISYFAAVGVRCTFVHSD